MRVKKSVTARNRHKKILAQAKGMQHNRTRSFRLAKQAVTRALEYSYRDRRNRKRDLRALWITRINAAARINGMSYSTLIHGLKLAGIEMNRKMLADLAVTDAAAFAAVAEQAKAALAK